MCLSNQSIMAGTTECDQPNRYHHTERDILMPKWDSYEEIATYLLNQFAQEFGVDAFEGKQDVSGKRSGTTWEIDAKGVRAVDGGFMIVECKRWSKDKPTQAIVGSLAYSILDSGAIGGIIVSPLGIQEGGQKVASAEGIFEVHLGENSTRNDFVMHFLNKFKVGSTVAFRIEGSAPVEAKDSAGNPILPSGSND